MSKQKIREWLVERTGCFYNDNRITMNETADLIHQYTQDQSGWVSVDDSLPITRIDGAHVQVSVLATDGDNVCEMNFSSGIIPTDWYEWSEYGDIEPALITHWQPLPLPPTEEA